MTKLPKIIKIMEITMTKLPKIVLAYSIKNFKNMHMVNRVIKKFKIKMKMKVFF